MRRLIIVMVIITTTATIITTTTANAAEQTKATSSSSPKALFQVAQSSDLFGYKLLHQLELQERSQREENGGGNDPQNLLISPFSLSTVLTMAMTGAQGNTYEEMRSVLGLDTSKSEPEKPEQLISAYSSILKTLNSSSANPSAAVLQLANAVALQDHYPLLPTFLDVVESDFHSKLFSVDFARGGKAAIEKINSWAGEKTHGKIPELFAEELDKNTKLVLLNALYFKGAWAEAFEEELTTEEEFTFSAEKKKFKVPMMHIESNGFRPSICQEGHLVELPYKGGEQSMLLFLPNKTLLEKPNSTISSLFLQTALLDSSEHTRRMLLMKVDLALPRFKLESSVQLKDTLRKMGMRAAFKGGVDGADFSRMTGNRMLKIAQVVQKTMIEVNEAGAEAAAASAVQMIYYSGKVSLPTIALHFNRPFLFAIRDNRLQVNLFVGIVNKPEGGGGGGGGEVVKKVAGEAKQKVSPLERSKEEEEEEENAENDNAISIDEILQLLEGRE